METVSDMVLRAASKTPDAVAVRSGESTLTYTELLNRVQSAAAWIAKETVPGEVVPLHAENSPEWIAAYLGIIRAGRIANPIGLRVADDPLLAQVHFGGSRIVLHSARQSSKMERLKFPSGVRAVALETLFKEEGANTNYPPSEYASLLYTSGTTGVPKAVRLTHTIILQATKNIIERLRLRQGEVYYQILPLSHSFGLGNVHATLALGGTVVLATQTTDYQSWLSELKATNTTFFAATPLTLSVLTERYADIFFSVTTLRTLCTNTGPMPPAVTKAILAHLTQLSFFTYYGLTEASRSTIMELSAYPDKLTSVGTPVAGASIVIMESPETEAPPGAEGEVWVRGTHVIKEYWRNPPANAVSFANGYLRTGDIGRLDAEGFLFITGREDDVVNIAGEKVSLQEVDLAITELPFVADAMCIERPDARQEFVIEAQVILKKEAALSPKTAQDAIIAHCRKRLDNYKMPRILRFVDSLPRTDSGKAKRKLLRAQQ